MRGRNERLRDIQEAIAQIMKYTSSGRETFDQNNLPNLKTSVDAILNTGETTE